MLSRNQKKLIASMAQKKYRDQHDLFLAEGAKTVNELLEAGMTPSLLIQTNDWQPPKIITLKNIKSIPLSPSELKQASLLKSPREVLALFPKPKYHFKNSAITDSLCLVLDGIQDPGNMGTIIRLADWFNIKHIICSLDSADIYNPKVVQATMGAIARIKIHYTELPDFITNYKKESLNPVFGSFLNGKDIYKTSLSQNGLIILGNEGNGIRPDVEETVTNRITIPSFATTQNKTESLNVGIAAAIICSEFKRRKD